MALSNVHLRSGTWIPSLIELRSLPENVVASRNLYFHLDGLPTSRMRIRVPGRVEIDPARLPVVALHPDEREIELEGVRWDFHPVDRGSSEGAHEVLFHSNRGGIGMGALPAGIVLGEATDDELVALIALGRLR
jgi:hypothetical protein